MVFDDFKGFAVTLKRIPRPPVTVEYPDVKREMSNRFRGPTGIAQRSTDRRSALRCMRTLCSHLPHILP